MNEGCKVRGFEYWAYRLLRCIQGFLSIHHVIYSNFGYVNGCIWFWFELTDQILTFSLWFSIWGVYQSLDHPAISICACARSGASGHSSNHPFQKIKQSALEGGEWRNPISTPLPTLKRGHVLPIAFSVHWTESMPLSSIRTSSSFSVENHERVNLDYTMPRLYFSSYARQSFAIHSTCSFVRNTIFFIGRVQCIVMVIVDSIECNIVSPPVC